ncbi:glycosyltransferase family A protein [Stenotrophomonas sp.]|uniref:glycosyltransferase family 2 protein n=1 Tax=Stenotrophomonas sp. TaxID=69392 RepID=UPI0028AE8C91|nr:glycosyltransferase family A protein [Stenotrophomonas sp.]
MTPGHDDTRTAANFLAQTTVISRNPLISVIMTAYNTEHWVEAAATSILQQTWSNLELLVVDDQSSDRTLEKVISLQRKDHRVRALMMNRNGGTYSARNAALDYAQGEVITFMDSDDYSHPDRLKLQLEALQAPQIVASTCNYERRDEAGQLVKNRGLAARQALISLMFKRVVVNEIGWFDSVRFGADDEYFERLRHVYGRSSHLNVDATLYTALWRPGSLANNQTTGTNITEPTSELLSPPRRRYKESFTAWHASFAGTGKTPYMPRKSNSRQFQAT